MRVRTGNDESAAIEGADDSQGTSIDDVGVDHGGAYVLVPEQRLDRADIGASLEEMRGEAVTESVARRAAVQARSMSGGFHHLLNRGLVDVVAYRLAGRRILAVARGREQVLPRQAMRRVRHLLGQPLGQVDRAEAALQIPPVGSFHQQHLRAQLLRGAGGEQRDPVMAALPSTDHQLVPLQIDVLDAQRHALHQAESAPIEQRGHQVEGRRQVHQHRGYFASREHLRQVLRSLGPIKPLQARHVHLKHSSVQEHQRAKGLVLAGSRGASLSGERVEERGDLLRSHLARVTPLVEADEGADPVNIGILRLQRVVQAANGGLNRFDERHCAFSPAGGVGAAPRKDGAHGGIGLSAPAHESCVGTCVMAWRLGREAELRGHDGTQA